MRMTIKLMITRQCHSRSVKKRTAFSLYFLNHATKKTSHWNQERSWDFGWIFLRLGVKHGREGSVSPQRCY